MLAACGGEGEGGAGAPSHCPPDSVPQTPAGGLRPPALPAQELLLSLNTKKLIKKIYQAASNPRY